MHDKNKKILDAATELFGLHGFDNTSTQSIAKHAGIGTGTLFKYFSDKEELIKQAYLHTKLEMIGVTKNGLDPQGPFESILRTLWDNILQWCLQYPHKHSFVQQFANSRMVDPDMEQRIESEMLYFQVAVKAAQDQGVLIDAPIKLISMTCWAMLNSAIQCHRTECGFTGDDVYQILLNAFGLRKDPT